MRGPHVLSFALDPDLQEPFRRSARYAVEVIGDVLGLQVVETEESDGVDLYYGNDPSRIADARLSIAREDPHVWLNAEPRRVDIDGLPILSCGTPPPSLVGDGGRRILVDLPMAIFRLLSGWDESSVSERDRHGRVPGRASLPGRLGLIDIPVVNRYIDFLRQRLDATGRRFPAVERWPHGKRYAVGLSHDVDRPQKYDMSAALAAVAHGLRGRQMTALPHLVADVLRCAGRRHDPYWNFEQWVEAERQRGFRSAFYFAVTSKFHRDGTPYDVAYQVSGRRYRAVIRRLIQAGWEVGLHASYDAYRGVERFIAEKRRLEAITGTPVRGGRHHYWRLNPDKPYETLRLHAEAGFEYDTSLAFNEDAGFRRGIALPFDPFDLERHEPITTLQIPATLMDGHLHYNTLPAEEAARRVVHHLETVKTHGGLAVLNWHVRVWDDGDFAGWRHSYLAALEHLGEDSEAWVTSPGEIARWWRQRRALVQSAGSSACVES